MTQNEALDILKMGRNVFLTGPAGSGKTYLLNSYIQYLSKYKIPTAVTASTGIAATHMNGRTIHSWAAIGVKSHLTGKEISELRYHAYVRARITSTKVLIIDEISMLDAARLDTIDQVCRALRDNEEPFGGLQIVLCGDFFQLPPVHKRGEAAPEFAYESGVWGKADMAICYLEKQYRQEDKKFLEVLNAIRENRTDAETTKILMERHQRSIEGFAKPTKLYSLRRDVDAINNFELVQIQKEPQAYWMEARGKPSLVEELKRGCLAPEELILKEGALVMFIQNNFERGYVNGTLGTVVGFDPENNYPMVRVKSGAVIIATPASWAITENDKIVAEISQVPLILAWAITIHKSQGMTLECAEVDLSKAFADGMGYVALSRVKTLDGIKLMGLNDTALRVSEKITNFDKKLKESSEKTKKDASAVLWIEKRRTHKAFITRGKK
ncbi:MAG: PIF1 family DEAD/DEAH box helicase [Candidatus Jorgensenbacteria bacterium]